MFFGRPAGRPAPTLPGILLTLLAVLGAGCRGGRPEGSQVLHDLVALAGTADRDAPWDVVLFGSPQSFRLFQRGFVQRVEGPGGSTFMWAKTEARMLLDFREPAPRTAVLDIEPFTGVQDQRVHVFLNDAPVAELALPAGRSRQRIELPAAVQAPGENRLTFRFDRAARADRWRLAAGVHSLTVAPTADPALPGLLAPGSPAPFAPGQDGGVPSLVQAAGTRVRYALDVPAGAELRFTPGPAASGGPVRMRVSLQLSGAGPRELWQGESDGAAREVTVSLAAAAGVPAILGLHVDSPGPGAAWGAWRAARVTGPRPLAPPEPVPLPPEPPDPRVDALRQAVAGDSVMLVILDAAAATHFHCYGYERDTTPEIDRIAAEGVLFEEAYTPAPYTLAAMASLWTSRYPDQHQAVDPRSGAGIHRAKVTLPDLVSAAGIPSAGFVANGMAGPGFGFDRGFSRFEEVYLTHGIDASAFAQVLPPWLDEVRDRRVFTYVHVREPHWPYDPPPPYDTRFGPEGPVAKWMRQDRHFLPNVDNRKTPILQEHKDHVVRLYDGNLAYADHAVGELRRQLEARGMWDRTVLVVAADHGEAMWEHGHVGHEVQVYEASIKVPLIVRFRKGQAPAGVRLRGLVDLLDLAPTLADLFGVRGRGGSDREFEGRSLLPMLYGAPGKQVSIARSRAPRPRYSLRLGRLKYVFDSGTGGEELYDVPADPAEASNLAGDDPVRTAYYRQLLQRWLLRLQPAAGDEGPAAPLTPQQQENLKALGYVQ